MLFLRRIYFGWKLSKQMFGFCVSFFVQESITSWFKHGCWQKYLIFFEVKYGKNGIFPSVVKEMLFFLLEVYRWRQLNINPLYFEGSLTKEHYFTKVQTQRYLVKTVQTAVFYAFPIQYSGTILVCFTDFLLWSLFCLCLLQNTSWFSLLWHFSSSFTIISLALSDSRWFE